MFAALMTTRRFAPMFWCQFLSAFNDNFVRQMLAMLLIFRLGGDDVGSKVTLAVGIFVLPSILLSALGGEIADASDKASIARRLKLAEIGVQAIAALGFVLASLPLLYLAVFGLGVLSALFGPIKYGILPDHLRREELVAGNALVEGATFAAIILGLVVGGYAAADGRSPVSVVIQLAIVALACYFTARFIPATHVAAPGLRPRANVFASTRDILRELRRDDRQWVGAVAVSWFWAVGAVALSLVPVVIKSRIGAGIEVETAVNVLFAVGIAIGSLLAAVLAHGRIKIAPAPYYLVAMAAFLVDLGLSTGALPRASREIGLGEFFESAAGLRIIVDVVGVAAFAGLFVVPVFAAVQSWAGEERRARVVGGVNTLNSIYMVGGTVVTLMLKMIGLTEPAVLIALGIATVAMSGWLLWRLPAASSLATQPAL